MPELNGPPQMMDTRRSFAQRQQRSPARAARAACSGPRAGCSRARTMRAARRRLPIRSRRGRSRAPRRRRAARASRDNRRRGIRARARRGRAVRQPADVVAQQDVDARHAEPLEALGVRAHHRVIAVVEHRRERPRRKITLAADARVLRAGGHEPAADLRRDHRRRLRAAQRLRRCAAR